MRARLFRTAALLPICLVVGGCLTGTRAPLWSIYGDPTTQAPATAATPGTPGATATPVISGPPVVFDQRIEMYSLPAFSLRLGGFQAYHYPYPYYLHPYPYRYPHPSYAGCCVRARPAISRRPAATGPLGPRKSFGLAPPLPRLTTR